jgi:putative ABC transport system permease protein
VLGTFATLALVLTAVGIFATVASAVATRTREMGVRLALGAPPASVVRLVVRDALIPVALGSAAGIASTHWLQRIAEAQLFGVRAADPAALAGAVAVVASAAVAASYVPARQATRVDPISVLRAE